MVINGQNGLACGLLIEDVGTNITVEPIRGLPVIKDLVVDMEPFFAQYRSVLPVPHQQRRPGLQGALPVGRGPRALRRHHQVHPLRLLHDVVPRLLGQLVVRRARPPSSTPTASSSTPATRRPSERLDILNEQSGVWRCRTAFNCTEACPRGIKVTQAIEEVKRAILFDRV